MRTSCLRPNPHIKPLLKIQGSAKKGLLYVYFKDLQWTPKHPLQTTVVINTHNKCNSKYTMRLATRVQVLELWPFKYNRFCARKKTKATCGCKKKNIVNRWLVLHWIYIGGKGLCKSEGTEFGSTRPWPHQRLKLHGDIQLVTFYTSDCLLLLATLV
jgi:hypothetical protein